jgi:hypothetical protein
MPSTRRKVIRKSGRAVRATAAMTKKLAIAPQMFAGWIAIWTRSGSWASGPPR